MRLAKIILPNLMMGLLLVFLLIAFSKAADTSYVTIADNFFSPKNDTIHVGTAVKWTNEGIATHTSTSNTDVWASDTLHTTDSYSRTFNTAGTFTYHCAVHSLMEGAIVVLPSLGISDGHSPQIPEQFQLRQNYPNPFNPATSIDYSLPTSSRVILTVYNVLGSKIRTIVDEIRPAGNYVAVWDGRDAAGESI